jgi:hypothetical protein
MAHQLAIMLLPMLSFLCHVYIYLVVLHIDVSGWAAVLMAASTCLCLVAVLVFQRGVISLVPCANKAKAIQTKSPVYRHHSPHFNSSTI